MVGIWSSRGTSITTRVVTEVVRGILAAYQVSGGSSPQPSHHDRELAGSRASRSENKKKQEQHRKQGYEKQEPF